MNALRMEYVKSYSWITIISFSFEIFGYTTSFKNI